MPRVISYTPKWLSRPSPGFQLFNTSKPTSSPERGIQRGSSQRVNGKSNASDYVGPTRIMARRGTEILVVVGKYIRWTDLVSLKDDYEEQLQTPSKKPRSASGGTHTRSEDDGPEDGSYRVWKSPAVQGAPAKYDSIGSQSSYRRADTAALCLSERQSSCHSDFTHSHHCHTSRFLPSRPNTERSNQTQDIHRRPYDPCSFPISSNQHLMASIRSRGQLLGNRHSRCERTLVGVQSRQ